MKVYFIRHGQTTSNKGGTHQGWGPIGLSELGFEQAREAHEFVGNVSFDKYYGSDLLRTRQTAELIFPDKFHAGEIIFDENLREIDTGVYFGHKPSELEARFGDEYGKRRFIMDLGPFGVESSEHLKSRVEQFKARLEADARKMPDGKVAVVAHGGIIRVFSLLVSGIPYESLPAGIMHLTIDNCSVNIFDYRPEKNRWMTDAINLTSYREL